MIARQFPLVWLRAVSVASCWVLILIVPRGHAAHINRHRTLILESSNASNQLISAEATPPPLYPPSNMMGSINVRQAINTYDIVKNGRPEKVKLADDISGWDCDKLAKYMEKLQKRYEKVKFESGYAQYSASKTNAKHVRDSPHVDTGNMVNEQTMVIDKHFDADKLSEELHMIVMETLRTTETFGLKCGASDEGCFDYGTELLDNFAKLVPMKKEVEGLVSEAGWLAGEAENRLATPEQKAYAQERKDHAFQKAKELWEFEELVTASVMIKAAACGTRPPMGPWGIPADGCNLKPEDPIMKALLTDDPAEFIRRWRAEISKTAGIEEEFIHVDISQCLGKHGRPTLPPDFFKKEKEESSFFF